MSQISSAGQITIIDQNDGKPITCVLSASDSKQQIFTKNDSGNVYSPNFSNSTANGVVDGGTPLTITPKIYIGGYGAVQDLSTNKISITNRKWSTAATGGTTILIGTALTQDTVNFVRKDGSTTITVPFSTDADGHTLIINGNLKPSKYTYPIYFECDYTDPITNLVTKITANIELNVLETGTNAVFIRFRGQEVIESSGTSTKNKIAICADLIRASGIDRDNLQYTWYDVTGATQIKINQSITNFANKYAISDTLTTNNPVPVSLPETVTSIKTGDLTHDYSDTSTTGNTLTLSELAIDDIAVIRVDIKDTKENKTYTGTTTVFDVTDPFEVKIESSTGDKLLNGQGSTVLTPVVYNGASAISDLTGYSFIWSIYDKDGKTIGFVDNAAGSASTVDGETWGTAIGGAYWNSGLGLSISDNGYNTSNLTLTHSTVTNTNKVPGDFTKVIVKIVVFGVPYYYEVTNMTTSNITLKPRANNDKLSSASNKAWDLPSTANYFNGGKLFLCVPVSADSLGVGAIRKTTYPNHTITVWGQDIEGKARIVCKATSPA